LSHPKREVGLWFFELVCLLPNGLPFLVTFSVAEADETTNISTTVLSITSKWLEMVERHPRSNASPTVIVFDSYYMDTATEALFITSKIMYFYTTLLS
jgi:hypothetical protein